MRLGIDMSLTGQRSGSAVAAIPGSAKSVLPITPAVHYHANFGVTAGARVTAVTNQGSAVDADASEGLGASSLGGPTLDTDALGRHFFNFNGDSYLNIGPGMVADSRACSYIMVLRLKKAGPGWSLLSQGNASASTAVSTGSSAVGTNAQSVGPYLKGCSISAQIRAAEALKP